MTKEDNYNQWKKEEKRSFKGWDFAHTKNRIKETILSWDYKKEAKKLIKNSKFLLDIGTGGGEILLSLAPLPKNTFATEGWPPNVPVAKESLSSYGIEVFATDKTEKLPFDSDKFDLILNRHSPYSPKEIYRVLKNGGIFFTQQVGSDNLKDLVKKFNPKQKAGDWSLEKAVSDMEKAGLKIEVARKWSGKTEFKDISALVYYLKAIPWIVPGFSVDKYLSVLERLQKKIDNEQKIIFTIKRFLIKAKK